MRYFHCEFIFNSHSLKLLVAIVGLNFTHFQLYTYTVIGEGYAQNYSRRYGLLLRSRRNARRPFPARYSDSHRWQPRSPRRDQYRQLSREKIWRAQRDAHRDGAETLSASESYSR